MPEVVGTNGGSQGSLAAIRSDCITITHLLDSISVQVINHHPEFFGDFHGVLQLAAIIFSPEWHQSLGRSKKRKKPHPRNLCQAGFRTTHEVGTMNLWKKGSISMPLNKHFTVKNEIRWHKVQG